MSGNATLPYGGMTRIRFEGYLSPASACGLPRPGRTPNVLRNATWSSPRLQMPSPRTPPARRGLHV